MLEYQVRQVLRTQKPVAGQQELELRPTVKVERFAAATFSKGGVDCGCGSWEEKGILL